MMAAGHSADMIAQQKASREDMRLRRSRRTVSDDGDITDDFKINLPAGTTKGSLAFQERMKYELKASRKRQLTFILLSTVIVTAIVFLVYLVVS